MMGVGSRAWPAWGAAVLALWLGACSTTHPPAPVEARSPVASRTPAGAAAPSAAGAAAPAAEAVALPGAENAGKPGYYTVKPGDTLVRIGLDHGRSWREIARWNNLENPNVIEVGQVLRVVPPEREAATAVAAQPVTAPSVESKPIEPRPSATPAAAGAAGAATPVPATPAPASTTPPATASTPPAAAATPATAPAAAAARDTDEDLKWAWPANGPLGSNFDEGRNKGIAILGKAGDPVLAAADGRVVYAGAGLRGYGNLLIVRHNNTYLSAYAHNQALLVKEDQVVRRGQKIAEMGSTDADRVQLHFEIRRQGRPVDPAKLLPPR